MRIIAGSLKGRQLKAPTWAGLRPTSDKLRETIFNILAPRIAGARVLDLYAGTGALGIEALSRGAASATFVDADRRAQALVAENLARCGLAEGYVIIRASVTRALATLAAADPRERFDIVLLDPPYTARARESTLERRRLRPERARRASDASGGGALRAGDSDRDSVTGERGWGPASRNQDDADAVLAACGDILAADGIVVLEHARRHRVPPAPGRLALTREVAAGDSALAFYACRP
jgi:16S rRNA (guanine966-N2)-methyltransferase